MQTGASALQSLRVGAADILTWWRDELSGLVPQRTRRRFARGRPRTVLAQVGDGFVVVNEASGGVRPARGGDPAPLSAAEALYQLVEMARSKGETSVGIRLPCDACFTRKVELPAAARNELRRILEVDLERATPFKHKDVYTAHVIDGEAATKGKLRVRQLVIKRDAVDPLVADIRAAALEVAFIDCWEARPATGLPLDFIEPRGAEAGPGGFFRPTRILLALVVLLTVSALGLTLYGYESALAELNAQTTQARTQAAAVRRVLDRSDAAVADLVRLQDLKLRRPPAIEVLEEISRILPDTVWLTDLRLEGDIVDMSGLATSAAGLPTLLERSPMLADASLTAPVTLDQREDKERFSVRVRVKQQAPLRQAATGEKK